MKVTLITGRSLDQGLGLELGKYSEKYQQSVAVCEMNPKDMETLGVKIGENIRITTRFGSIILSVAEPTEEPSRGVIFIPYGPYVSLIVDPETHGTGMPSLKGIPAEVEPIEGGKTPELSDFIKKFYEKV